MIMSEADFNICFNDNGPYFSSDTVDLEKDSLVVPVFYNGMTGTIEFHRENVTLHPANGEDKTLTVLEFVQMLENESNKDVDASCE